MDRSAVGSNRGQLQHVDVLTSDGFILRIPGFVQDISKLPYLDGKRLYWCLRRNSIVARRVADTVD